MTEILEVKSLFSRMHSYNYLNTKIIKLQEEIKEKEAELNSIVQKRLQIEQSFIDELAESGLKEKFIRYNDTVFCIYPRKVRVIETESHF